jgi:antitoxin HigA-1
MASDPGLRMKAPAHPGAFLKAEVIEPYQLTVTDAAAALGVTRPALSALLNGRSALSAEMAIRFEKAFGISMETLMRMQSSFEIAEARKRSNGISVNRFEL